MNVITDTLRQLVQRKLWPVAILLLAALVAVPVVLAKEPAVAPSAPAAKAEDGLPATFVSAVDEATTEGTERKRVLGDPKDPFEPAELPKAKKTKKAKKAATAKAESTPTPDSSSGGPSAGAPRGPGPAAPPVAPAPTATPTPAPPQYSIKVRFGTVEEAGGELPAKTVTRLSVLPDEEKPVLVYRGVEDGGKVAIFEITGAVVADGDGRCAPSPQDCQYLKLQAGETEFITVTDTGTETDAQYELDLVKINTKKATSNSESLAKASSTKITKAVALRKRNRYVFDETTGTLRRAHGKTPNPTL
jgi:hypothetical protein